MKNIFIVKNLWMTTHITHAVHGCESKLISTSKKEFGYTFEPWLGITVAYTHTCLQNSVKHLDPKRSASTTLGEASLRQYMSVLR